MDRDRNAPDPRGGSNKNQGGTRRKNRSQDPRSIPMMPGDRWVTPYESYGDALAALRKQRGLSINELAHRSHLNARQVRRFEANEAIPIGKELEKIERNLRGLPAYRHLIRVEKIQTVKVTIPDFELPPMVHAADAPSSTERAADSVPAPASAPTPIEEPIAEDIEEHDG